MTRAAIPTAILLFMLAQLPASAACASEWGGLYSTVTIASDYRYQGVSNSDRHAAIQANVHNFRPDGWYAGVFASQVDLNDFSTSYEVDVYAGRNLKLDPQTEFKLDAMYTAFPDNKTPGATYNFWQGKVAVTRTDGPLTVIGLTSYVPEGSYGSGKAWRVEGEAHYAISPHLILKVVAGRRWSERNADRSYWSLGGATTWKHLVFEVRYQDTDLSKARCGYNPDICGPALTGSITAVMPLILF